MRFREVVGQQVMDRQEATRIGKVALLIVDCAKGRVVALRIGGVKGDRDLVDWDQITGTGPDAVVITGADALREAEDDERARVGDLELLNKRVLTDRGVEEGKVSDVEFDPVTGSLQALITTSGTIESERLRSVGPYAVIVRASPPGDLSDTA
jgi:sporulation protein YlmC with PRC-barrel domain